MAELNWRSNLRGNLVLWPGWSRNISVVLQQHGRPYDEEAFLAEIRRGQTTAGPNDTRSVRNTAEILMLSGLADRSRTDRDLFRLTKLGACAYQFLSDESGRRVANEHNLHLIGVPFLRGLLAVAEMREIWNLLLACEGRLSNEELNRFMARAQQLGHYASASVDILRARHENDPRLIGRRFYRDEDYGNAAQESDQRKAINPWFLLAGAGWLLLNSRAEDDGEMRTARDWALDAARTLLPRTEAKVSISDGSVCRVIDSYSGVPKPTAFTNYAY